MNLEKKHVLDFLKDHKLMAIATHGDFPWIATVYYTFDDNLSLYFLSNPNTLHCQHIHKNNKVAVSIADSRQNINQLKKGLQISGIAEQISDIEKIKHALKIWKDFLKVEDRELSYENMIKKVITSRIYKITPKRIKLFNQELFNVEDGEEPVMELY